MFRPDVPPPPVHPSTDMVLLLRHAMVDGGDRTTLILKGHIAVEQTLYTAASNRLKKPEAILKPHTKFSTKLDLMKALYGEEVDQRLYTLCGKLNKLRNDLAHKLEPQGFDTMIEDFLVLDAPSMPGTKRGDLRIMDHMKVDEILLYKMSAIISDICEVVFAEEIENYEGSIAAWIAALPSTA